MIMLSCLLLVMPISTHCTFLLNWYFFSFFRRTFHISVLPLHAESFGPSSDFSHTSSSSMTLIRPHRSLACISFHHLRPQAPQRAMLHTSSCLQWFAHCLFLLWIHWGPVIKELARIKLLIFNRMNSFLPVVRTHDIEFKQDLQLLWVFWYDDIVLSVNQRRNIYFTGLETFCWKLCYCQ